MDNNKDEKLAEATELFASALLEKADELRIELEKRIDSKDLSESQRAFMANGIGSMHDVSKEFEDKKRELSQTLKAMQNKFSKF